MAPVCILGAYELWPPGQLFSSSGTVTVRYMKPITPPKLPPASDVEGRAAWRETARAIAKKAMLEGLAEPTGANATG